MGPRAGLDGRKISSPPGFFFIGSSEDIVYYKITGFNVLSLSLHTVVVLIFYIIHTN